jgi:carboxylesterase family protein
VGTSNERAALPPEVLAQIAHACRSPATDNGEPADFFAGAHPSLRGERVRLLVRSPLSGPDSARFGSFHTVEVPYLFGALRQDGRRFTGDDRRISTQLQRYWIQFMVTGDPNGGGGPHWSRVVRRRMLSWSWGTTWRPGRSVITGAFGALRGLCCRRSHVVAVVITACVVASQSSRAAHTRAPTLSINSCDP